MAEGNPQSWAKWIAALDKLELLKPRAVIAGHKRPENDDHPRIIEETRSYFRDFLRLNEETKTAREFFERMRRSMRTQGFVWAISPHIPTQIPPDLKPVIGYGLWCALAAVAPPQSEPGLARSP